MKRRVGLHSTKGKKMTGSSGDERSAGGFKQFYSPEVLGPRRIGLCSKKEKKRIEWEKRHRFERIGQRIGLLVGVVGFARPSKAHSGDASLLGRYRHPATMCTKTGNREEQLTSCLSFCADWQEEPAPTLSSSRTPWKMELRLENSNGIRWH